jgi:OOP family OmpA-OmpF porin
MLKVDKNYLSKLAKLSIFLTLFLSFIVNSSEQKNEPDTYISKNYADLNSSFFYLGGKLGLNYYQHGCESWSIGCDKYSIATGIFAGYQFNTNFAVEAAYLDLGEAIATYNEVGGENIYIGRMKGLNLTAVKSINLSKQVNIFGKAGTFNWYGKKQGPFSKKRTDGWAPTVGAGITYQLTNKWQARFEYQYFHRVGNNDIGGTNTHFTSLGISYQFSNTKSTLFTKPDPIKPPPVILKEISFPLLFDFDSSELVLVDLLTVIINRLTKYPQATVMLRGYTDSTGSHEYNLALSKRRTEKVANYLVIRGVNEQQIFSKYYGEQNPEADNSNKEQRHLNRQVKILLPSLYINTALEQK